MEIVSVVICLAFIILMIDYMWKPASGRVLPHRKPIIGHILMISGQDMHKQLSKWADQYGDVYTYQVFNQSYLVLNGYESIYECLVTKGKDFGSRSQTFRFNYIFQNKDIVFSDIDSDWKKLRTVVHSNLKQYADGMVRIQNLAMDIAEELTLSIRMKRDSGNLVDPYDSIYFAVTNTIASMVKGQKYSLDEDNIQTWKDMFDIFAQYIAPFAKGWELDVFPWLRHFRNSNFKQLNRYVHLSHILFESMKQSNDLQSQGLVNSLIESLKQQGETPQDVSDKARLCFIDIMGAGILTSLMSLTSFCTVMAAYPKIQETMYSEIMKTLDETKQNMVTLNERKSMPYTIACLLELQRYSSILPLSIPHKAMCDTSIQDIAVKKGTVIFCNLWKLHHEESYWEDPFEFKPERFLDENNDLVPSDHVNRKRMLAFGAGARVCLGQSFAMARIFIFTTTLVKEFNIQAVDPDGYDLHDPRNFETAGVNIQPKRHKLKFQNRKDY